MAQIRVIDSLMLADARSALVFQQVTCLSQISTCIPDIFQFIIQSPELPIRPILNREADNQHIGMLAQWNANFRPT